MEKEKLLKILRENLNEMKTKFKITKLILFGSYAKNQQKENSDIDFLVEYETQNIENELKSFDLSIFLEELLKKEVEVGTLNDLIPEVRKYVEKDILITI
jgi:predicted nucleotidyltransferase